MPEAHTNPDIFDDSDRELAEFAAMDAGFDPNREQDHGLLLIAKTGLPPTGTIVLNGVANCHACSAVVPYQVEGWLEASGGGGGYDITCQSCGARISIMVSYRTTEDNVFSFIVFVASPITEPVTGRIRPVRLFYRSHTLQT